MNSRVLIATVVGGIVLFAIGGLTMGVILADFYAPFYAAFPTVMKTEPDIVPLALGNFGFALLFALIFEKWANIKTFGAGAIAGTWLNVIVGGSFDLTMYATTHLMTTQVVLVDLIVYAVWGAIGGGVIGWLLGFKREK
ncbi:MAG: hypothetical protein U0Y10_00200 [Spirosomataceae bacterium]